MQLREKKLAKEVDSKHVVIIGSEAFELEPLTKKGLKRISQDIDNVLGKVTDFNGQHHTVGDIVGEAILKNGKVWKWIQILTGVPAVKANARMTHPQFKHFWAVFWQINLFDRLDK